MTEPPRPPGEGQSGATPWDPTAPPPPPSYPTTGEAAGGFASPPPPDAAPPTSGGSYAPPGNYPPPGAYPPPGGGHPPAQGSPPGYPPGGGYGGPPPTGFQTNDEKTWAQVAHFGGAAGAFLGGGTAGWVGPLVALLARGNQSPAVRAHAVSALNFQIVWSITALIGYILFCVLVGFVIVPVAVLVATIFGVIAGLKASNGEPYNYPLSVTLVK